MTLLVKKPISALDTALTMSWRDAVKSIGKTIVHVISGKFTELPGDLAEFGTSIGLIQDQGEVAWLLIRRALLRAMGDLLREHRDLFRLDPPDHADVLEAEAGLELDDVVLEIDERFFRDPGALELLHAIREPFGTWLQTWGIPAVAARTISERLRAYFVLAVHEEWGRTPADYAKLKDAVDTPFTRAQDLERAWLRYEAHLWHVVNEPMFAEAFGLKSVYVPLHAYTEREEARVDDNSAPLPREKGSVVRTVVDLASALDAWLDRNRKEEAICVLSGGPGSGKSSVSRMYAAATMTKGAVRVLYVPLHLFDPKGDLVTAVGDYVRTSRALPSNPLEVPAGDEPRRLLIIFDGLDELAMQGKLAAETAQQFVREIDRTVDKLNQMKAWLSVLVSGRELVVQANATEFRRPGQVFHLLSYFERQQSSESVEGLRIGASKKTKWEDPRQLLRQDQRKVWWKKYREATAIEPDAIPAAFLDGELGDVTRQPLLLYLVALSFARKKLTLEADTNLNDVYADLVDAVWERGYERHRFRGINDLDKQQFVRVLEEIGLAAWHDERRTTTVKAIREHFETSPALKKTLNAFQEGAEGGVTRLLAAFYFRQHGEQDGDKTFEFTHKSFGEYLAARRIVRTLSVLDYDMSEHERDPDHGRDALGALAAWAELCGPSSLDGYYVRFLNREIRRRPQSDVLRWQGRLAALMTIASKTGMPMERTSPRPTTFFDERRRSRNAEEALLACAAACSDVTKVRTKVEWADAATAGAWIRRLQEQRTDATNRVVLESLRRLNLSTCHLDILDLYAADLREVDLTKATLHYSCLRRAILTGADLKDAVLIGASLEGARLLHADLRGATLVETDLTGAQLVGADFRGAVLGGAILSYDVEGAVLSKTQLAQIQRRKPRSAHGDEAPKGAKG
jgi:uncharacterized protein YjbI with pentapeptide repeats